MNVRMRFRTDSVFAAADVARRERGEPTRFLEHLDPELASTPPAVPGDVWRMRWYGSDAIAGYDICCPQCLDVHAWTTALNCASRRPLEGGGSACAHSGVGSCWDWSGSAEEGTLTANPSLHSIAEKGGCGFHGWLRAGVLTT